MIPAMLIPFNKKEDKSSTTSSSSSSAVSCKHGGHINFLVWTLALTSIVAYCGMFQAEAYPVNLMMTRKYPVNVEVENPEELISTLDNLIQNILVGIDSSHSQNNLINEKSTATNKRGIDLGLSRGFSGSQAAKHLMGMSAASFANGPGRRR